MKILIVEDNQRLSKNIQQFLELEGYSTEICENGNDAVIKALKNNYYALILDINIPGIDGMEVCKILRAKKTKIPILMLTSRTSMDDKIEGLNIGADDYMTKPFSLEELSARLKALIRRTNNIENSILKIKTIEIDLDNKSVSKNGKKIKLSPKEYAVLEFLLRNRGQTKNRTQIFDYVWEDTGEDIYLTSDTVEVHIAYLRKKLGKDLIITRRGFGYTIE